MFTLSDTYDSVTTINISLDRLDLSDGGSVTVDHLLFGQDCLPKTWCGNIIADEQDVSYDNPDCFWEPPIVFDQDAEDAYKQWKGSLEYFIKNGSCIEPMGCDVSPCPCEQRIVVDQYNKNARKQWEESFAYFLKNGTPD